MEIVNDNFAESIADPTMLEARPLDFNFQIFSSAAPGDGDDENEEVDENDNESGDASQGSDDDNPPLDKDVVHSPVTPQTGGKPKA